MNRIIFDFFPLILFFVALKLGGIYAATKAAIVATVLQILWLKFRRQAITATHWMNLVIIVVFGGATIYLQDEAFIKWKPTVLYWLFAVIMAGALVVFKVNVLKRLMGEQLSLPEPVWTKLTLSWSLFFVVIGILNLWVAFSGYFTTDQWATFKVFGLTVLLILFVVAQSVYLSRHLREPSPDKQLEE